jgi:hypothetical protein
MTRAIELLFSLSKKTGCSLIPFWICSISKLSMPTTRFEQQPVHYRRELLKGYKPTLPGILHGDPGIRFQLPGRLCFPPRCLGLSPTANYDWKTDKKGIRQTLYFRQKNKLF